MGIDIEKVIKTIGILGGATGCMSSDEAIERQGFLVDMLCELATKNTRMLRHALQRRDKMIGGLEEAVSRDNHKRIFAIADTNAKGIFTAAENARKRHPYNCECEMCVAVKSWEKGQGR